MDCPRGEEWDPLIRECVVVSCEAQRACRDTGERTRCVQRNAVCVRAPCPQYECVERGALPSLDLARGVNPSDPSSLQQWRNAFYFWVFVMAIVFGMLLAVVVAIFLEYASQRTTGFETNAKEKGKTEKEQEQQEEEEEEESVEDVLL